MIQGSGGPLREVPSCSCFFSRLIVENRCACLASTPRMGEILPPTRDCRRDGCPSHACRGVQDGGVRDATT